MKTITKDILLAAKFAASVDYRPALNAVQINDDCMVATDSYKLIKIMYKGEAEDITIFPATNAIRKLAKINEPFLLPANQLLKKLKFTSNKDFPILSGGVLCNDSEDKVSIFTTDLETSNVLEFKKVKETFPKWEAVLPAQTPKASVFVDVDKLIETLQAFKSKNAQSKVLINIFDQNQPLVINGKESDTDHIMALLMPVKS